MRVCFHSCWEYINSCRACTCLWEWPEARLPSLREIMHCVAMCHRMFNDNCMHLCILAGSNVRLCSTRCCSKHADRLFQQPRRHLLLHRHARRQVLRTLDRLAENGLLLERTRGVQHFVHHLRVRFGFHVHFQRRLLNLSLVDDGSASTPCWRRWQHMWRAADQILRACGQNSLCSLSAATR